jgi:hypothetical protein
MIAAGVFESERHEQSIDFAMGLGSQIACRRDQTLADKPLQIKRLFRAR